ncbi:hypothetical protein [Blastochloris viridis]|nr:hypothetical protein [Blastochloris viridis]ALK08176.1 hypothetical protein BVIR_378 [Blastochloris viridis]CUU44098.1 hypothetical protein BVIRIDIS_31450 [Blastochloris viridis]
MKCAFTTLACAGLVAATTALAPAPAQARDRGGAVAAGAIFGLAAGAMLGAAAANAAPTYYYADPPRRVYYDDPIDEPPCYVAKRRVWVEGYGWTVRRIEVCE